MNKHGLFGGPGACLTLALFLSCAAAPPPETEPQKKTLIVDQAGAGDYRTIQEAVVNARPGWVIKIRGGVYPESVVVLTEELTLEALDPAREPVILEGADLAFIESRPVWSRSGRTYSTGYQWPFTPPTDEEYSNPASDRYPFQLYEDEIQLRGYRNPFVLSRARGKRLAAFYGGRTGLAGAYASIAELEKTGAAASEGEAVKSERETAGRFFFDAAGKKLNLFPASGAPEDHRYAVPVIPHLLQLKAKNVVVRNLLFTHALDYALVAENADGGAVEGCLFLNCHFSALVRGTARFTFRGNIIEERGFYERYAYDDVAGTRYERSVIAWEPVGDEPGADNDDGAMIIIEDNVVRGTPFFISPVPGRLVVSGNVMARSVFGLLAPAWSERPSPAARPGRVDIFNNVFHHWDGGVRLPADLDMLREFFIYRNCFYLSADAPLFKPMSTDSAWSGAFYHNTIAFAGETLRHPKNDLLDAGLPAYNNVYYAKNLLQKFFVDTGTGRQEAIAGGPLLGNNLFVSPRDEETGWGTFSLEEGTYVYAKRGGAEAAASAGAAPEAPCFQSGRPIAERTFFDHEFDPPSVQAADLALTAASIYGVGAAEYSRAYRERLMQVFALHEKSPARDLGRRLSSGLPGRETPEDQKPDAGAREFAPR